jgi:3-dehydroquinate synthase
VIALGGGVPGDIAGFVAATYLRGLPFIQVPTTLLAQVDSSVGGKVGVDHAGGKNLIGAFHQPRAVLIETSTLQTLDSRQIKAGLAEIIKHGIIRDKKLFSYIESNLDDILAVDEALYQELIPWNCSIKARVVEEDETEQGVRAILNFGHTIGHAIEAMTGYGDYLHGEAVAIGMIMEARLGAALGITPVEVVSAIENLLRKAKYPLARPQQDAATLIESMFRDKKVQKGKLRFIFPTQIGEVMIQSIEELSMIEDIWNKYEEA